MGDDTAIVHSRNVGLRWTTVHKHLKNNEYCFRKFTTTKLIR